MESIADIPFVVHTGIMCDGARVTLTPRAELANHLGTLHAGAIYTLAESESGRYLRDRYADMRADIVPLLRTSQMRYKKPIDTPATATASLLPAEAMRFEKMFAKKGRGSVSVIVEVLDASGDLCATGEFVWYVQKRTVNL